jgi:gas vesicle protein
MSRQDPWFTAGLLVGALVAIAAVWLFAPEAGRHLMARLKQEFLRTRDEARAAGKQAEADIVDRYRDVRAKAVMLSQASGPMRA